MNKTNFFDTLLSFGTTLKAEVDKCTTPEERTDVINIAIKAADQLFGSHPLIVGAINAQKESLDAIAAQG